MLIEPIRFLEKKHAIAPKHDMVAELFFLFCGRRVAKAEQIVVELIGEMEESNLISVLYSIVSDHHQSRCNFRPERISISYQAVFDAIGQSEKGNYLLLSNDFFAVKFCLGYLRIWNDKRENLVLKEEKLRGVLSEFCPSLSETSRKLYFEWGRWERQCNNNDAAEGLFRSIIDFDSKEVYSRTELGKLLVKKGDLEGAQKLFQEAIQLDKMQVHSHFELVLLLEKKGKYKEAMIIVEEILKIDSSNLYALSVKPRIKEKLDD